MSLSQSQRSIPKFASFKPRSTAQEAQLKSESSKADAVNREIEDERGKRHHKRHKSNSPQRLSALAKEPVHEPEVPNVSDLFLVDRKGDKQNLTYGGNHRYSIPYFHRAGAGSVIGAQKALKIDRNAGDGETIILNTDRNRSSDKREKYVFARTEKNPPRPLKVRADPLGKNFTDDADFIPLHGSRKRRRMDGEGNFASNDQEHYRSIEGKAKPGEHLEDDELEYATSSDSSDSESGRTMLYDETTKLRTVELSRRTKEHPRDVEAWIDLIHHQDHLLGLAGDGRRKITSSERSSTAEIKLHLYEKALKNVDPSLANRERLLIGLMAEGATIWTFQNQSKKWQQISQENLDSILLGKHFLDFRQGSFQTFRYEDVKDIYLERIKSLVTAVSTAKYSETSTMSLYVQLFYTILRATLFMRESGYSEIARAIWQALFEYNWCGSGEIPNDSRLELFRDFWESEVPRIGDDGAIGWGRFISPMNDGIPISSANLGPWPWKEITGSAKSRIDEPADDDPYGVVLWSDIEGFLFRIHQEAPKCLRDVLIDAFLLFCRLPPLLSSKSYYEPYHIWQADAYVRSEILEWKPSWIESQYPIANVSGQSVSNTTSDQTDFQQATSTSLFQQSSNYFAPSIDTFLASSKWVNSFTPWQKAYGDPFQNLQLNFFKCSWLLNVLRRLVLTDGSESLAEYCLCLEWHNEPQFIKKTAKYLLKQHPGSLRLYNTYAMIERLRGNEDAANTVITAALSMASVASGKIHSGMLLWKTRIWWFFEENDHAGALQALLTIPDNNENSNIDTSSPALHLKSRQFLTSGRESLLSTDPGNAILYAELLLLLVYLTTDLDRSIQTAFIPFSTALIARGKQDLHLELFHQAAARLIHHHIQRKRPYRPSSVTAHFESSLHHFPSNTIFLSLHHSITSRLVLPLPSTSLSLSLNNKPTSLFSHLFHIRRTLTSPTQNPNLILSAFENAVADVACQGNAGLWRLYLLFCMRLDAWEAGRVRVKDKGKRKARTREVFWRAVRACPWARGIYLMALGGGEGEGRPAMDFGVSMDEEERRAVWRVLGEKELRSDERLEEQFGG